MDLESIGAIGSALGGVGQFLSGAGIGKKGIDYGYQNALKLNFERDSFNQKMNLAEQHGLHPLAMLGVPMSSGPAYHVGDSGPDFARMGAGLQQIASAAGRVEPKKDESAYGYYVDAQRQGPPAPPAAPVVDPLLERQRLAQVRRAEAEASMSELLLAERARGAAGSPPGARVSSDVSAMQAHVAQQSGVPLSFLTGGSTRDGGPIKVEQNVAPPHPSQPGVAAGADQLWVRGMDRNGKPVYLLRQDVVNADTDMGATLNYLAGEYGMERALQITAMLEQAPTALAMLGGAGYGALKLGRYLLTRYGARGGRYTFSKRGPGRIEGGSSGSW